MQEAAPILFNDGQLCDVWNQIVCCSYAEMSGRGKMGIIYYKKVPNVKRIENDTTLCIVQ